MINNTMSKPFSKEEIQKHLNGFKPQKQNIINALHALQDAHPLHYISEEILDEVSAFFKLTKAQLYGIVTYYSMFSVKPRKANLIRICQSPVCRMMGAEVAHNALKSKLEKGKLTELFHVETSECLGRCGKAPSMMINEDVYTGLTAESLDDIINIYTTKNELL